MALKTKLSYAVLTSTLFILSVPHAHAQRQTSVDGDITIAATESELENGTPAILIDSKNTLTIEPNNVSANPPGVVMTNGLLTQGAVEISEVGGQIKIGSNSGITADTGNGVLINANGVNINNSGSITGGTTAGSGADGIHFETGKTTPTIVNQGIGVLAGDRAGIYFDSTTGIVLSNVAGNNINSTATNTAGYGLYFNGTSEGTVTNSGTINTATTSATSAAIYANNGGSTLTINNNSGANLTSASGMGIQFDTLTTGINATINNAGTITAGTDGIRLDGDGKAAIHNQAGGVITAGESGILIRDAITGSITNNGTITSNEHGVELSSNSDITFVNTGTITNTNNAASGTILVATAAPQGSITNSGSLVASGTLANAYRFLTAYTGDITNSGSATSNQNTTMYIGGAITGDVVNSGTLSLTTDVAQSVVVIDSQINGSFTNSGTISSASTTTAAVDINANITGGFINSGNITLGQAGLDAIDFSGVGAAFTLTQNAGTIGGNINAGNAFANVININGGTISGNLTLGTGANTINIAGGSVLGNIAGNSGNDTLNITSDFTSTGQINGLHTITVQNAGTEFTATNAINNIAAGGTFTVAPGATFLTTSTVTEAGALGTLKNEGTFGVTDGGVVNLPASNFVNDGRLAIGDTSAFTALSVQHTAPGNGTYAFEVTDTGQYGQITTNSAATDVTNDTFVMVLNGEGFIASGDQFLVLDNGANNIVGANTITVTTDILDSGIETLGVSSPTLTFVNLGNATNITLQASRNPFQALTESELANTMAVVLDSLIDDPLLNADLKTFISQLDVLRGATEITAALESLAPLADNGLIQMSFDMHNKAVNTIVGRVNNARSLYDLWRGISSGDEIYYGVGAWAQVYGGRLSQKEISGVQGYKANVTGITFGVDKFLNHQWLVGTALTYATGEIESRRSVENQADASSFQFSLYSMYDSLGPWFLDAVASAGLNRYKTKRLIQANTFHRTASADYKAWQYSIRGIGGYNLSYGKYRITPLLGARFGTLDQDPYTETGAGGLNLASVPKNVSEAVTSFGVRFSSVNEFLDSTYVPELRIMAHYDFLRDTQESTSNFVANGGIYFDTHGPKPDPLTYNIGFGVTTHSANRMSFYMNYDFEWKDQFVSHSGFIKLRYEW